MILCNYDLARSTRFVSLDIYTFDQSHKIDVFFSSSIYCIFPHSNLFLQSWLYCPNREIEKLKLSEMTCRQGVIEIAKM